MQIDLVDLLQQTYKRVTVVGDDAQSIYRFRGAVPDVFKVFKVQTASAYLKWSAITLVVASYMPGCPLHTTTLLHIYCTKLVIVWQ